MWNSSVTGKFYESYWGRMHRKLVIVVTTGEKDWEMVGTGMGKSLSSFGHLECFYHEHLLLRKIQQQNTPYSKKF